MEDRMKIHNRDGRWMIKYGSIVCLEALQKKIHLYTGNEELCFCDTISRLEQILPPAFVRCHRSYIINSEKIKRVIPGENLLILEGGRRVPYSRTYRKAVRKCEEKLEEYGEFWYNKDKKARALAEVER